MDILVVILLVLVVLICVIFIFYTTIYNKFQDYIVRINEVEASIDTTLRNKYDLLSRSVSIIRSKDEDVKNESFDEIIKLRSRKISNFDLYRKLVKAYNELLTYKDNNEEFSKNEEIIKIITDIEKLDDRADIEITYYNKNISEYNKLITKFPYKIIALLNKYKDKLYFDRKDMSDEDYEDFKL